MSELRAPFPYFGSKMRAAHVLWQAFGRDVPSYLEPFCGSAATLLQRPGGPGKIETVNDAACAIANFWRAMQADPEAVAKACDRPVNECDMHAMHLWLVQRFEEIGDRLREDLKFYDAEAAGLWAHGQCSWIGGGWCGGIKRGRPRPNLCRQGVHTALPSVGNDRGIFGVAAPPTLEWFSALQNRLRRVRVCCGDWSRVVTPNAMGVGKNVGGRAPVAILLDAPYSHEVRDPNLYSEDEAAVSAQVRDWAVENGENPELRIALCGYSTEHEMPPNWVEHEWKGARGYAAADNENRTLERIWFSPYCLPLEAKQGQLFA